MQDSDRQLSPKAAATRQMLIAVARQLFAEKGYAGT